MALAEITSWIWTLLLVEPFVQVIAAVLIKVQNYFMNDEERALEIYRITQQIIAKITNNFQNVLDQDDDEVEFRPLFLATKVKFEDIIGIRCYFL